MTTTTKMLRACAAGLLAVAPLAHADFRPDSFTLKAGVGDHHTRMAGAGLNWDWDWRYTGSSLLVTARTEAMFNEWRAEKKDRTGHQNYTQVAVLPALRLRPGQGSSPWFFDAGIGLSWMDRKFETPDKTMSTEWNFYDVLGAGYTFGGPAGRDEVDLRLVHFSNAGFRNPNPGLTFVQVRYTRRF